MKILVTGGSSFVGAHLCRLGAAQGHDMVALYQRTPVQLAGVAAQQLDLGAAHAGQRLRELGAEALVHLACKVKGSGDGRSETPANLLNRRMMDAVLQAGLPTVYASSTCVHWPGDSGYKKGRVEDERRLAESGLPWAVVRPCAPYGPRIPGHQPAHVESFHTLAGWVERLPLVPVIGNGKYLRQPVHVDDFNGAILGLLERGLPDAAYDSGGPRPRSFDDIVAILAAEAGKRRRPLHIPKRAILLAARFSRDFEADLLDTADTDDLADPRGRGRWPRPRGCGRGPSRGAAGTC